MYRVVRVSLAASLPVFAIIVAGLLRYGTHLPFLVAVIVALPIAATLGWRLSRVLAVAPPERDAIALFVGVSLVLGGALVRWLYVGALMGLAGGDAAAVGTAMHVRAGVRFGALRR